MPPASPDTSSVQAKIDALYRTESRRVFATLIRLLGDFDRAEEALHDAFRTALERWPKEGIPAKPRPWLVSVGRFQAIDKLRRDQRYTDLGEHDAAAGSVEAEVQDIELWREEPLQDDRLRLIFTCCHPALSSEAQIALTLREMCGLTTEEIASAFLVPAPTLAQRIVRAKAKIRDAGIPYKVPESEDLPGRLAAVLRVVYLVYNEGYAASSGESLTRADLSSEAIRLGRLLVDLMPEPEAKGLLALMLIHDSRREARTSPKGDVVLLEEQDRSTWNSAQIAEGQRLTEEALSSGRGGAYSLQAAIAAVHSEAASADETDWEQIVGLYDVLLRVEPSPVVALNRAVAVAMRDGGEEGAEAGLALIDEILDSGELEDYHLTHAARADLFRRMDRKDEARTAYRRALELTPQEPARRFLERRLAEL